ncbi:MAG: RHS repeat protein [Gammaproteobacteria bacterium]|nr:RHS repeat protein [Gammaproteobacteria bacterium]
MPLINRLNKAGLFGATYTEYLVILISIASAAAGAYRVFGDDLRVTASKEAMEVAGINAPLSTPVPGGGVIGNGDNEDDSETGTDGNPGTGDNLDPGTGNDGDPGEGSNLQPGTGNTGTDGNTTGGTTGNPGSGIPNVGGDPLDPNNGGGGMCTAPGANAPTFSLAGNPINLANGNKFQSETDFMGWGPFPLSFVRSYNSFQAKWTSSLGHGWRHNYSAQIERIDDNTVKVIRSDGTVHRFHRQEEKWSPENGVVDGLVATYHKSNLTGWRYRTGTGTEETYSATGQLLQIQDMSGAQQRLAYDEQGRLIRVEDNLGNALSLEYQGPRLSHIITPSGERISYEYDGTRFENLQHVSHGKASLLSRAKSLFLSDPAITYHYEDRNFPSHLTGMTDESGLRYATWRYDLLGRAISTEHGNGIEKLTINYMTGNRTQVTNAAGQVALYTFTTQNGVKRLQSIDGEPNRYCPETQQRHIYDENGFLWVAINAEGYATVTHRNERGLIVEELQGVRWQDNKPVLLPESRRQTTQWHPELALMKERTRYSLSSTKTWSELNRETWTHDNRGRIRERTLTNLTRQTQPYANQGVSRTWHFSYVNAADPSLPPAQVQIDGPRPRNARGEDDVTTVTYDNQGRPTQIRNALGHTVSFEDYGPHGMPERLVDANGISSRLYYNPRGWLTRIEHDAEHSSYQYQLDYYPNGLLRQIDPGDGSSLTLEYNSGRQLLSVTDAEGQRILLNPHPVSGEWTELAIEDAKGNAVLTQQRVLDPLGRLSELLGNASQHSRIQYDRVGNPVQIQQFGDMNQILATLQQFNAHNQLVSVLDAAQGETGFQYNGNGQVTEVRAANGAVTRYTYDGLGQLLQQQSPDTGTSIFRYDEAGNRVSNGSALANTKEAIFEYDMLNRLVRIMPGDAKEAIEYRYDQTGEEHGHGIGRLTSIIEPESQIQYRFNAMGLIEEDRRIIRIDGAEYRLHSQYQYTPTGQVSSITYPNGQTIGYQHQHGQIQSIDLLPQTDSQFTKLVSDIHYLPFGTAKQWQLGNGLQTRYHHDLDGRIDSIELGRDADSTPLWQQRYEYDAYNNVTQLRNPVQAQEQRFAYDSLQRLVQDTGNYGRHDYTYDPAGNRLTHIEQQPHLQEPVTTGYRYATATNRLTQWGDNQVTQDWQGNQRELTSPERRQRFDYNRQNRPTDYWDNGQRKARYGYNVLGQRLYKIRFDNAGNRQLTLFHYDPTGQLLTQVDWPTESGKSAAPAYQNLVWLQKRPVAVLTPDSQAPIAYIQTDHLQAPRLITDANQRIIWQWRSDAFGVGMADADPDQDGQVFEFNLRFPGQYFDEESRLFYNYHRHYNPEIGRYTQADPIGLLGGVNTFGYVRANPANSIDRFGLYDTMVHYFMTYTLAVAAGLPPETAYMIAQATQYIDNNSDTAPMYPWLGEYGPPQSDALNYYHFTLDYGNQYHGDKSETLMTRFIDPSSTQLTRLSSAADAQQLQSKWDAAFGQSCSDPVAIGSTRYQLYGEYLHAFEDTFAHRDTNNNPYDVWNLTENDPAGIAGHGGAGHSPDHSYNHVVTVGTCRSSSGVALSAPTKEACDTLGALGSPTTWTERVTEVWQYNELRTLEMEKEVFEKIKQDFSAEISQHGGKQASWAELAGTGSARIGLDQPPGFPAGMLQKFNSTNEEAHKDGAEAGITAKLKILQDWLLKNGFEAAATRQLNITVTAPDENGQPKATPITVDPWAWSTKVRIADKNTEAGHYGLANSPTVRNATLQWLNANDPDYTTLILP